MAIYAICLDIGHNQSSASAPEITGTEEVKCSAKRLNVEEIRNITLTQLILTDRQMDFLGKELPAGGSRRATYGILSRMEQETGEELRIGSALPERVAGGEKFAYFKVKPADFDSACGNSAAAKKNGITHGILMGCFAYAIVRNIFRYNKDELGSLRRQDACLLVGCPTTSDWTSEKAEQEYAQLVKLATGTRSVRIVPESRAAMFSGIEGSGDNISAEKGAIVFDFGSSTADCTYMLLGRRIIEFSWTLGAHQIEYNMALEASRQAEIKAKTANIPFSPGSDRAAFMEVMEKMRRCKEAYYSGQYGGESHEELFSFCKGVSPVMDIDSSFMDRVAGEMTFSVRCSDDVSRVRTGSWKELCRAFFREAERQVRESSYTAVEADGRKKTYSCGVDTVVLTGGASKMDFIAELCREVFSENGKKTAIICGSDPSYTVSQGLAWVEISDENRESCIAAAKQAVLEKEDCAPDKLKQAMAERMYPIMQEIFIGAADLWAKDERDYLTGEDLKTIIKEAAGTPETEQRMKDVCTDEIKKWKERLSAAIEEAVNSQVKSLYTSRAAESLIIPADVWRQLQSDKLNVGALNIDSVFATMDFSTLIRQQINQILQAAAWIIAVSLALETFGISVLVAWIYSMVADDLWRDTNMKKKRSKDTRKRVAEQMPEALSETKAKNEMMETFVKSLDDVTQGFEDLIDETVTTAVDIVTLRQFSV